MLVPRPEKYKLYINQENQVVWEIIDKCKEKRISPSDFISKATINHYKKLIGEELDFSENRYVSYLDRDISEFSDDPLFKEEFDLVRLNKIFPRLDQYHKQKLNGGKNASSELIRLYRRGLLTEEEIADAYLSVKEFIAQIENTEIFQFLEKIELSKRDTMKPEKLKQIHSTIVNEMKEKSYEIKKEFKQQYYPSKPVKSQKPFSQEDLDLMDDVINGNLIPLNKNIRLMDDVMPLDEDLENL